MFEITLEVEGMHCGMCEAHVNDAVRKAAEVKSVSSSHAENKTVIVAETDCSEAAKAAIEAEGYHVTDCKVASYEKKGFFAKIFKKK